MTTSERWELEDAAAAAGLTITELDRKREARRTWLWLLALTVFTVLLILGCRYVAEANRAACSALGVGR